MDKFHEKVAAWIRSAQKYTKFWVAVAGGVLAVVVGEIPLPDDYVRYAQVAIALATAFSVYQFPNAPTDSE